MTSTELAELLAGLRGGARQPRRVVVNASGYAVNPWRAAVEYGVQPRICFVRNDGWTLAAPVHLAGVAFAMWRESWVALCELPPHYAPEPSGN